MREDMDLTQQQVASSLGITQRGSYLETGVQQWTDDLLVLLANYYHVSIDYLLSSIFWRHFTITTEKGWNLSRPLLSLVSVFPSSYNARRIRFFPRSKKFNNYTIFYPLLALTNVLLLIPMISST